MLLQVGRAVPTTPWELVLTSSRETQFVLLVLAVFSVVSWYFIVLKWWQFRRMRQLGNKTSAMSHQQRVFVMLDAELFGLGRMYSTYQS